MTMVERREKLPAADAGRTAKILAELERRGAESCRHGRGSLLRHLYNTFDVLTTWRQPDRVRLAGLMHSIYATDAYARPLFDLTERVAVRSLIGEEAEHLSYLFCALEREDLFTRLRSSDGTVIDIMRIADRRGHEQVRLNRRDVGDLLVLHIANVADQACLADGGPTVWLSPCAELARWAKRNADTVPPIFGDCTAMVSRKLEEAALEAYDTALRMLFQDIDIAAERLVSASQELPHVAEPLVWLGYLSYMHGDDDGTREHIAGARKLFEVWARRGTSD